MTHPLYDLPMGAGGKLDPSVPFHPVRIAVLSISDTRGPEEDFSGNLLADSIKAAGHALAERAMMRDDIEAIRAQVKRWTAPNAATERVDVIITTGGTGLTGRDVTPEALEPLMSKRIEGFSTVFHMVSYGTVGLSTLQSRALAGIIDGVFVFCLPGSRGAVQDGWDKVIRYQLDSRHRPCNMIELMPRLNEA